MIRPIVATCVGPYWLACANAHEAAAGLLLPGCAQLAEWLALQGVSSHQINSTGTARVSSDSVAAYPWECETRPSSRCDHVGGTNGKRVTAVGASGMRCLLGALPEHLQACSRRRTFIRYNAANSRFGRFLVFCRRSKTLELISAFERYRPAPAGVKHPLTFFEK